MLALFSWLSLVLHFMLVAQAEFDREFKNSAFERGLHDSSMSAPGEEMDWMEVPMPEKSYFAGFQPPDNALKWRKAQLDAMSGRNILLDEVLKVIKCPGDILTGEKKFKWIHRIADVFVDKKTGFEKAINNYTGYRAPVVSIGYKSFDRREFEGYEQFTRTVFPEEVLRQMQSNRVKFPRKFIAVGLMDENWGWLSTHFLNRTASWGFNLLKALEPNSTISQLEQMSPFLDHPKVIMVLVNQHHNISHPKVLSLPRGIFPEKARMLWDEVQRAVRLETKKNILLFTASSRWGPRPMIIDCVKKSMGNKLEVPDSKISADSFMRKLVQSRAVLCLPGLGYDTFRLWESIMAGSMPVLERGVGFDRILYKLPALLLDDFADVTPQLVQQAYVEALYRAGEGEWDYKRLTQRWWERLIYKVSETGNINHMLRLHPPQAEDLGFARPMIPYDCLAMGGCGHGTKRVPKKSCAIDFSMDVERDHNWYWEQGKRWPYGINLDDPGSNHPDYQGKTWPFGHNFDKEIAEAEEKERLAEKRAANKRAKEKQQRDEERRAKEKQDEENQRHKAKLRKEEEARQQQAKRAAAAAEDAKKPKVESVKVKEEVRYISKVPSRDGKMVLTTTEVSSVKGTSEIITLSVATPEEQKEAEAASKQREVVQRKQQQTELNQGNGKEKVHVRELEQKKESKKEKAPVRELEQSEAAQQKEAASQQQDTELDEAKMFPTKSSFTLRMLDSDEEKKRAREAAAAAEQDGASDTELSSVPIPKSASATAVLSAQRDAALEADESVRGQSEAASAAEGAEGAGAVTDFSVTKAGRADELAEDSSSISEESDGNFGTVRIVLLTVFITVGVMSLLYLMLAK